MADENHLRSYSSPLNLGHKHLDLLFSGSVIVQEKIDGSQFSFGVKDGALMCRSRRIPIELSSPGMFSRGVEVAQSLAAKGLLIEGWTYRGEYLSKPKHNTVAYERVPNGHVILFDIDAGFEDYVSPTILAATARALDLEAVPTWVIERQPTLEEIEGWIREPSILGGEMEGVVFKNYALLGADHKTLMGKYVTAAFKEKHGNDWKKRNPGRKDVILNLVEMYKTEARWEKAIQHLKESGELQHAPQDIGPLIREVQTDVHTECAEEIKEILFKHFWKDLGRQLTAGLPEWYKSKLLEEAIGE